MTLIEHLYELRHRLVLAAIAVVLGSIVGFIWFNQRFGPVQSLSELMTSPYCALPVNARATFTGHSCGLLQTQPFEGFKIRLEIGIAAGFVLTSPAWLYQIWAFITPGLYRKERRMALTFVTAAVILFTGGAVMAYIVFPTALKVLSGVGGAGFVTALAATAYVSFMLNLLVLFGVSFELPLIVVMLNRARVLHYEKLRHWRRGMMFAMWVFAAAVTPGQDPLSMTVLATGLCLLLELAIQLARLHDRKLAAQRTADGFEGLGDDEASPTPAAEPFAPDLRSYDDVT